MALVTTFMTTPVVIKLYPEWYQKRNIIAAEEIPIGDNKVDHLNDLEENGSSEKLSTVAAIGLERYCIVTMLNRIESVPSMMALIQLLKRDKIATSVEIHALRLLELTQRTSAVMKYKDLRETKRQDPVLNVLRTFANLIGIKSLQTHLDYCPSTNYIKTVAEYSTEVEADLVLLPWINNSNFDNSSSPADLEFVHQAFSINQHCTTGLFIDRGFGQIQDGDNELIPQIIVAYREGCQDDEAALLFALRLQAYRKIDLTVVRKGSSEPSYANNKSVQEYTHHRDINKLFLTQETGTSDVRSNIVCRFVQNFNGGAILKTLARPLDKHDLVVLGRRHEATSIDEEQMYESVLGQLGFNVLKHGTKSTSVLILQSSSL